MHKVVYNGISFKLKGLVGTCIVVEKKKKKKKKSEIAKKKKSRTVEILFNWRYLREGKRLWSP